MYWNIQEYWIAECFYEVLSTTGALLLKHGFFFLTLLPCTLEIILIFAHVCFFPGFPPYYWKLRKDCLPSVAWTSDDGCYFCAKKHHEWNQWHAAYRKKEEKGVWRRTSAWSADLLGREWLSVTTIVLRCQDTKVGSALFLLKGLSHACYLIYLPAWSYPW